MFLDPGNAGRRDERQSPDTGPSQPSSEARPSSERESGQIWWRNNRARRHYRLLAWAEFFIGEISRIRKWVTKHPMQTSAASLSLIGLCLLANAYYVAKPAIEQSAYEQLPQHWYYDLNTGELFVGAAGQVAPIDAPSGPFVTPTGTTSLRAGVRAFVFSCADCSDTSRQFIGYLEIFHPKAKQHIDDLQSGKSITVGATFEQVAQSTGPPLVADPIKLNWVPMSSEEGSNLISSLTTTCADGAPPRQCNPPALVVATQQDAAQR